MVGSRVRSFMRKGDASLIAVGSRRRIVRPARMAPGDQAGSTATRIAARRVELRCAGCGYGIIVSGAIPLCCPMCRTSDWEPGVAG